MITYVKREDLQEIFFSFGTVDHFIANALEKSCRHGVQFAQRRYICNSRSETFEKIGQNLAVVPDFNGEEQSINVCFFLNISYLSINEKLLVKKN